MTGKTHIALGMATASTILPMPDIQTTIITLLGAILGSLLPDIDHPKAMINQRLLPFKNKITLMIMFIGTGVFILSGGLGVVNKALILISGFMIIVAISTHRTFSHSLIGLGFIIGICYLVNHYYGYYYFSASMAIAAAVHILADMFTHDGIALLYPFSKKRIKMPLTVTTNGIADNVLGLTALGYLVLCIVHAIPRL